MSSIDQQFLELSANASEDLKKYTLYFNYTLLLDAYANYMQAINGDNTTPCPSGQMGKDIFKWKAWKALEGKSTADAKKDYVNILTKFNDELYARDNSPPSP